MNQNNGNGSSEDEKYRNKTSLIINYLPKNFTQEDMKNFFSSIGEVENCTLMRDKVEGFSLGYGFVNYSKPEDAQSAIDRLNGLKLGNKMIKVSYARPSSDEIKRTNIYISGLPGSMDEGQLVNMFKQYGTIIEQKLIKPKINGLDESSIRNAALIRFDKRTEADRAINELNGKIPPGMSNALVVRYAFSPKMKAQKRAAEEYLPMDHRPNKMMMPMNKGYPPQPPFPPMGGAPPIPPQGGLPPQPPHGMMPGGGGIGPWNEFGPPPPLKPPMTRSNNFQVFPPPPPIPPNAGGMRPNGKNDNVWSLFVYNLGTASDEKDLWKMFGPFGAISSVKLIQEKGFGFVNMLNYKEAENAVQMLNGSRFKDHTLQVSFKTNKN